MRMSFKGFTLIELMLTLAILALLTVWAIPSFSAMKQRYEMRSSLSRLSASMMWARSQAISQQSFISVSPTNGAWSNGWVVYIDQNRNSNYDSAVDTLLKEEEGLPPTITSYHANSVSFNPSGIVGAVVVGEFRNDVGERRVYTQINRIQICDLNGASTSANAQLQPC